MFYLERLPCPVLVTNCSGHIKHTNRDFKKLVVSEVYENMDYYFPPACRIFLQSHAWPLLLKNGEFNELYMQLLSVDGKRIPVMTNARISEAEGERIVIWLFFVAKERQCFEAELLKARQHAEEIATQLLKVNTELQHANARISQYAIAVKTEADQFAYLSLTDPLTDLGNRRALSLSVEQWMLSTSDESVGSLLLIDIDFFKQINDHFGHAEGDSALCKLAQQLLISIRAGDTVVRHGGEEFAIWLPNTDRDIAKIIANRVHNYISQIQVADRKITVSIGISNLAVNEHEVGGVLEQLMEQADAALYEAKARGRNRTVCFDGLELPI